MSNKTIPQLPLANLADLNPSDKLVIVVNGVTSHITLQTLSDYINP